MSRAPFGGLTVMNFIFSSAAASLRSGLPVTTAVVQT